MIKSYFKSAWRSLWKNRAINMINLAGLSIGMTAAVFIFLWVQNEVSYDNYHPSGDRIYRITNYLSEAKWTWDTSPLQLARMIKSHIPAAEKVSCIQPRDLTIRKGEEFFSEKKCAYIDSAWFELFHYDFIEGNATAFFRQPFSLILTRSKAKKYFGDTNPIGQTLRINMVDYRVQAIVKDSPPNSSIPCDLLIPIDAALADSAGRKREMYWGNFNYQVFVRLGPGASSEKTGAAITAIMDKYRQNNNIVSTLRPLKGIHFDTDVSSFEGAEAGDRKTVYIFSVLGVFLLLIACINYVNLTTARASLRAKEVSLRKIVGAGRGSLFTRFILESLMISFLALLITLALVETLLPFYRQLTGKNFTASLTSPVIWEITGGTLLVATLLNGIYPALLLSSFQPLNVFKGSTLLKWKDVYFRKSLVVLQFTFSIILIISTLIIHQQLAYIQNTNPGFDRSQLFSFDLPQALFNHKTDAQQTSMLAAIKQELLSQTSVAGATVASQSIVDINSANSGSADWDGHDSSFQPTIHQLDVDEDYKNVFGLQLQQGRWFDPGNTADGHNFILNETAVNEFNIHKPVVGQRFSFQGDTGKIIAIVRDFHFVSLHKKIEPLVIFHRPGWGGGVFVKTQPGKTDRALATARGIIKKYAPNTPFDYTFLDDQFDALYKTDQKVSTLILIFSTIAILVSCMGLFGLAAFTAEQRTKEIGIRKVLGATVGSIMALLSKDFIRLVLLSIVIAAPVAWWAMHRWLEDFAYHIPVTGWFFLGAGAIALLIAGATISTQSLKAAKSNPIDNLRVE